MLIDAINHQAEWEVQRSQVSREELVERITRTVHEDGVIQPLKGLHLARQSVAMQKLHSVLEPSFCIIAQGSKQRLREGDGAFPV